MSIPVTVVGDLMVDVLVVPSGPLALGSDTPSAVSYAGGGSGANVAAWLASSGVTTSFVGRVGDDPAGREAVEALRRVGVATYVGADADSASGTCVVLLGPDGERTMLPDRGANDRLAAEDLHERALWPRTHLHLSGYTLLGPGSRTAGQAALEQAAARGMTTSVTAASAAPLAALGAAAFLGWVGGVDLLVANAAEARVLTGSADVRSAAIALGTVAREAVVTDGPRGAVWSDGWMVATAASGLLDVVDTAGAGDAFVAGFLSEWLVNPEPESALAAGNRLAARAVTVRGARPL